MHSRVSGSEIASFFYVRKWSGYSLRVFETVPYADQGRHEHNSHGSKQVQECITASLVIILVIEACRRPTQIEACGRPTQIAP